MRKRWILLGGTMPRFESRASQSSNDVALVGRRAYLQSLPSNCYLEIEMHRSTFVRLLHCLLNQSSILISARLQIAIVHGDIAIFLGNHELQLRKESPNFRTDGMAVGHNVLKGFFLEAFR